MGRSKHVQTVQGQLGHSQAPARVSQTIETITCKNSQHQTQQLSLLSSQNGYAYMIKLHDPTASRIKTDCRGPGPTSTGSSDGCKIFFRGNGGFLLPCQPSLAGKVGKQDIRATDITRTPPSLLLPSFI